MSRKGAVMNFTDDQLDDLVATIRDSTKYRPLLREADREAWRQRCGKLLKIVQDEMERRGLFDRDPMEDNSGLLDFGDN